MPDPLPPLPPSEPGAKPPPRRSISDVVAASQHALMLAEIRALKDELEAEDRSLHINGATTDGRAIPTSPTTKIIHVEPIRLPDAWSGERHAKLHPDAESSVPVVQRPPVKATELPRVAEKRWVLARGSLSGLVTAQELASAYARGVLRNPRLLMREEFGTTWHHPLHFVNEFSLVAELDRPVVTAQPADDGYYDTGSTSHSSTSRLLDYFDTPLDEQLYKDRDGLPCRSCHSGLLLRESRVKFADLAGATAMFLFVAALACGSFGFEWMTKTIRPERERDRLVAQARDRLKPFTEISRDVVDRVLGYRWTKRGDFEGLSKEATSALQGAEIIMEEAKLLRDDVILTRFGGGMMLIGAAVLAYLGLAQLGHRSFLKCNYCGHVVRS